jgi:hypothetical protein
MSEFRDASSQARFERAFVVTRFLLGHKADEVLANGLVRSVEAKRVAVSLVKGERRQRALVLAAEWGQVLVALARRGFAREHTKS